MSSIVAYHRPTSLDEAAGLLTESNRSILAGGTAIVAAARADWSTDVEFVDLQSLGLDQITLTDGRLRIDAMVRLGDLTSDARCGDLLRDLARRELPSAMRNQATIGGTVVSGSADSVMVAGLLVHDAIVEFHNSAARPLASVLAEGTGGAIVVAVNIDPNGRGVIEATGRTPADEPIVAAIARSTGDGLCMALTGVAPTVVEVDSTDPVAGLEPPADFRGSSEYRLDLATTLCRRAVEALA